MQFHASCLIKSTYGNWSVRLDFMNKILLNLFCVFIALNVSAQKDVTQFLGIPVDGKKSEMIKKIRAKGFAPYSFNKEILHGEFNGEEVNVYVVTENDKVYRIMICDDNTRDERSIRLRFNRLCHQFENNSKYIEAEDQSIPEEEDISYEMSVNNKRYEAIYYQRPDTLLVQKSIEQSLAERFTPEELANPTEDISLEVLKTEFKYYLESNFMKNVWFMISEKYGKYYIVMFYDNEYNRANGEDL